MKFILRLIRRLLTKYMYLKGRYYLKLLNNIGKNYKKKNLSQIWADYLSNWNKIIYKLQWCIFIFDTYLIKKNLLNMSKTFSIRTLIWSFVFCMLQFYLSVSKPNALLVQWSTLKSLPHANNYKIFYNNAMILLLLKRCENDSVHLIAHTVGMKILFWR